MRIRIDSSAEVTTKLRGLLAGEKCLRGQWFLTNQRIEPAGREQMPPPARKVSERSLKIEYLQEAGFRATQSAATLKRNFNRCVGGPASCEIPRYSERGHIEAENILSCLGNISEDSALLRARPH